MTAPTKPIVQLKWVVHTQNRNYQKATNCREFSMPNWLVGSFIWLLIHVMLSLNKYSKVIYDLEPPITNSWSFFRNSEGIAKSWTLIVGLNMSTYCNYVLFKFRFSFPLVSLVIRWEISSDNFITHYIVDQI